MPPRKEHTFNGVENQAVVHIDVTDGTIHCFPQRAGDTIIFNCHDPGKPPKAHPCEVRWMVTGLAPGRFVRIQPKPGASGGVFKGLSRLDVHHGFNSATSGAPDLRAGGGPEPQLALRHPALRGSGRRSAGAGAAGPGDHHQGLPVGGTAADPARQRADFALSPSRRPAVSRRNTGSPRSGANSSSPASPPGG